MCQNDDDYYRLLYKICSQTLPCKHLYHLYPVTVGGVIETTELPDFVDYRNGRDFQVFRQQLSRVAIFNITLEGEVVSTNKTRNVLQNTMPIEWLPNISIALQASSNTLCSEDVRNLNPVFVGSALYGMHIYKVTISDDNYCQDPNERFFTDPLNGKPLCVCKPGGKLCNNDANFNKLFSFLLECLIVSVFAFIIVTFATTFIKRSMLDDLSRQPV